MVKRGCRLIVVACNTATVSAVRTLRAEHPDIPIVGIEPGVKPAAAQTQSGKIAVLVTESTARSERLARLIVEHASAVQVFVEPCPGWAAHVEQLALDDPALEVDARARLEPLLAAGVDRVVLGCTHYRFLRHVVQPIVAGKPFPYLMELSLEKLGTKKEETLVVGDRLEPRTASRVRLKSRLCLMTAPATTSPRRSPARPWRATRPSMAAVSMSWFAASA